MTDDSTDYEIPDLDADDGSITCLVLPIQAGNLLVPSISVAEMALVAPIFPDNSGPDWFLGHYSWRNQRVPLASFEKITNDQGGGINPNGRIAVFNNTGVSGEVPFIAIPTQGIPKVMIIKEDTLQKTTTSDDTSPYELMTVTVGDEEMIIPNIPALETAYLAYKEKAI